MALQSIVRAEDLSVVFQPIVSVRTKRIFAYEALVRCSVPAFSKPPVLFERAVASQCTGRLGRMIREVAVPLCAGMPLFLNVHPAELQERWVLRPDDPMFTHDHDVYVEITESVPLLHYDLCHDVLREIRSKPNVWLVVDDLGAGYSNLRRIADLEPKVVKLDRDLIAGMKSGTRQQTLVNGVVRLCEDLRALVVAEGVETAEEFFSCRDTGVDYIQGFLFARPGFPLPTIDPAAAGLL